MADGGFESYLHNPQQSRRDKMRNLMAAQTASNHNLLPPHPPAAHNFPMFPVYDPSLCSSSELIQSSANYYNSDLSLSAEGTGKPRNSSMGGLGVMINAASSTSSSSSPSTNYMDSHVNVLPSLLMNPSSMAVTANPFQFTSPHCNDEVMGFKSETLSTTGKGLSLSLSFHRGDNPHHQSEASFPLGRRYCGPTIYDDKNVTWSGEYIIGGSTNNDASRGPAPPGPFAGYVSILRSSKFLKPAQQLLEELHFHVRGEEENSPLDLSCMDPPVDYCLRGVGSVDDHAIGDKKFNLISMLEEVCKRYKQYYQQMQAVVASLECVAGIGNATPYANAALKALSKHFKSVKAAIAEQLQSSKEASGLRVSGGQRPNQSSGLVEPRPVWRPQRGLPERAVAVLRAWLFEHFLHPYPTDTDKLMLAKQTGLSRNQVSNWFINARVRLWKPMVEEIHMLETRQVPKDTQSSESNAGQKVASRNEFPNLAVSGNASLSFDSFHGQPHPTGRVSLTLGLHQNNGLGASDPSFSVGSLHHVGIDGNSQGYVMTGFEVQNRQFGRNPIGGQLLG